MRWALLLLLSACQVGYAPTVPWPQPPPPPVVQPPPTPEPPADPLPPGAAQAVLEAIQVGQTVAEATQAVGSAPVVVAGAARWFVGDRMVYAVLVDGRVVRKGVAVLEENP